jgi:Putative zinc-finger
MAKVEELKRKQAADRRAALLGLAADRNSEQQGHCLTSREMSELLDDNCSPEQRHQFLVHLSSCDPCYCEWLELQQLLEENAAQGKPLLFRRKVLTVTGSLLAVAASVIFYLNIDNGPGPYGPPLQSLPEADSVMEESLERASEPLQQKAVKKRELPAPMEMGKQEPDAVRAQLDAEQMVEKKEMTAGSNAVQSFSKVSSQAEEARPAPAARVADPVHQWLQLVTEKCSRHQSDQEWSLLALQGKSLPVTDRFPGLPAIVEHVARLARGEKNEIECGAIKRIIEESYGR